MSALHDRRRKVAAVLRVLADERRVQDRFGYSLPPGHPWADSTLKPTASPGIQQPGAPLDEERGSARV